jgi:hypothetical protein
MRYNDYGYDILLTSSLSGRQRSGGKLEDIREVDEATLDRKFVSNVQAR